MHLFNVIVAVFIYWLLTMQNAYHGTSGIWVSLEGCYRNLYGFSSNHILYNNIGPMHCFDSCPGSEYIGLQETSCKCNVTLGTPVFEAFCNVSCPHERDIPCGSMNLTYVYRKVTSEPNISGDGEIRFGYILKYQQNGAPLVEYKATSNKTEAHEYYCYAAFSGCSPLKRSKATWLEARSICLSESTKQGLVPYDWSKDGCYIPAPTGNYWIGMIWLTPTLLTTTAATTTTKTTVNTTAPTIRTTTEDRSTPTLTRTLPITNYTSPLTTPSAPSYQTAIYVAVTVGIFVAAIVITVSICWWKKWCCFRSCQKGKEVGGKTDIDQEQKNVEMDKINNDAPLEIPGFNTPMGINAMSSVPPGSTRAPFHGHHENDRPITARQRDIQGGQYARVVSSAESSDKNMGGNTQNHLEDIDVKSGSSYNEKEDGIKSDMTKGEKVKGKIKRKEKKKDKHMVSVDKEYEEIEANTENHAENLNRYINDDLSAVNERTVYPNVEINDKEKKNKKKKKKHKKEYSYSDEERTKASDEPGTVVDFEPHSRRPIATASRVRVKVTSVQDNTTDNIHLSDEVHNELNDNNNDTRTDKKKRRERSREKLKEILANGYDGIFDAPVDTPVLEEQTDLKNARSERKHKEKRKKDKQRGDEAGAEQEGLDLHEVHKESNDGNGDTRKEKKKKRKRSRERGKDILENGYDEIFDATAETLVLEEQTDLQNEGSKTKRKKRNRKKDKKRGDEDGAEQ